MPGPLSLACRCALLGVSRSGYYAWRRRAPSARAIVNQQLVVEMRRIHADVDRSYGSPRMQEELLARDFRCGRHRVARLMQVHGIRAKQARRFQVTTDSRHSFTIAPNRLDRQFAAAAPNRIWMGDLTFIPRARAGATWPC
jgi:transposase InsO family protein